MEPTNDSVRQDSTLQKRSKPLSGLVKIALTLSVLSTVILIVGFSYGASTTLGARGPHHLSVPNATSVNQSGLTTQSESDKTVHLFAIGDSLAHGLGDASGRGFVGGVSEKYRNKGYKVIQSNLGVDGMTSSGLQSEIHQASLKPMIGSANVILISIGGNDLNNSAGLPKINTQKIAGAESTFSTNLKEILATIRKDNPEAPIFLVGLYNPYANIASNRAATDTVVQTWNMKELEIANQFVNTVVVQTYDLFERHDDQLLYVDHFHPNQTGYQLIATRIWQDIQGS